MTAKGATAKQSSFRRLGGEVLAGFAATVPERAAHASRGKRVAIPTGRPRTWRFRPGIAVSIAAEEAILVFLAVVTKKPEVFDYGTPLVAAANFWASRHL